MGYLYVRVGRSSPTASYGILPDVDECAVGDEMARRTGFEPVISA